MKCAVFAVLAATATATNGSAVTKLVGLLNNMAQEVANDRDKEEKEFTVTQEKRGNMVSKLEGACEENENKIKLLTAEIEQGAALVEQLAKDILDLDTTIDRSKKDETAATNVRELDASDFAAVQKDLEDTISAVKRALETLRAVNKNTAGDAALVELKSQLKVESAKKMLEKAMGPDVAQDAGNAFESKTGGPIGILEDIQVKMEDELYAAQQHETQSKNDYKMLMNALKRTIDDSENLNTKKKESLAEAKQNKANAEADKTDAEETLKSDRQTANDTKAVMSNDQNSYEARQQLREEEISAIKQAVNILSEMSTAGSMFAQLRASVKRDSPARLAEFLRKRGTAIKSTLLTQLASAAEGPDAFKSIKKMIQNMIVKLQEEATAESTHQGWCDTELATNKQTRDDKSDAVIKGSAAIDQLNANIQDAKDNISDLNEALAQLSKDQSDEAAARQEEHALNTQTIKTAEEDLEMLAKAKTVLNEFYGKAVESGAGNSGDVKSSFEGQTDTRKAEGGAGVIEIIQSIEFETSRSVAETKADEEAQQNEFKRGTQDREVDQTQKQTTLQNTQNKLAEHENNLASESKELKANKKALADADRYYEKLKPSCVDAGVSFEERTARRKEEIESLQEALKILSGDSDF